MDACLIGPVSGTDTMRWPGLRYAVAWPKTMAHQSRRLLEEISKRRPRQKATALAEGGINSPPPTRTQQPRTTRTRRGVHRPNRHSRQLDGKWCPAKAANDSVRDLARRGFPMRRSASFVQHGPTSVEHLLVSPPWRMSWTIATAVKVLHAAGLGAAPESAADQLRADICETKGLITDSFLDISIPAPAFQHCHVATAVPRA